MGGRSYRKSFSLATGMIITTIFLYRVFQSESQDSGQENKDDLVNSKRPMYGDDIIDYLSASNISTCKVQKKFGAIIKILNEKVNEEYSEQKTVRVDAEVAPITNQCVVYSLATNNKWSFDEAMEQYGCEVFSFDCTTGKPDHDHSNKFVILT